MTRVALLRPVLRVALIIGLLFGSAGVPAANVKLPAGMGGVPDIGAIPCRVFSQMIVVGPLGTRLSLLTWAAGYFAATSGKTLDEVVTAAAEAGGGEWTFDRLTAHLVDYCAAKPEAATAAAVRDLGTTLGAVR
ncbi:MAG: hypothetical protein QY320_11215 [Gammaproteobacteria bacterium]|nr:MAG: hypothetical protein QY320_11215 [Gammaproteobacteria bacterium]